MLGLAISVLAGQLILPPLMDKIVKKLGRDPYAKDRHRWLSSLLGCVERAIYTLAIVGGSGTLVAVWLGIKSAAQWERRRENPGAAEFDNAFLVGSGISLLIAMIGAAVALGRLPVVVDK